MIISATEGNDTMKKKLTAMVLAAVAASAALPALAATWTDPSTGCIQHLLLKWDGTQFTNVYEM